MHASPATLLSLLLLVPAALAAGGRDHRGSSFSKRQNRNGGNGQQGQQRGGNQNGQQGQTGQNGNGGGGNAQTSLTLDPSQVQKNLANDGQNPPVAGQVASRTSTNNFINDCLTQNLPLTNGEQVTGGSCNPTPMGAIVAANKSPSCKFTNPKNGDTIQADKTFTMTMAIKNLQTGNFVNAQKSYFAAPAQVNGQGILIGHSHVVIEKIDALNSVTPADTTKFAFFKGLNDKDQNGVLSTEVTGGLPVGVYKMSSINSAANHQPALVGVAQHGSIDDAVYFTVTANGQGNGGQGNQNGNGGNGQGGQQNAGQGNGGQGQGNQGGNGGQGGGQGGQQNGGNNGAGAAGNANNAAAGGGGAATDGGGGGGGGAAAAGGNLQKFTGALGGAAPPVTGPNQIGKFTLEAAERVGFNNAGAAIDRSCAVQQNTCSDKANGGDKSLSVTACQAQETQCKAANK